MARHILVLMDWSGQIIMIDLGVLQSAVLTYVQRGFTATRFRFRHGKFGGEMECRGETSIGNVRGRLFRAHFNIGSDQRAVEFILPSWAEGIHPVHDVDIHPLARACSRESKATHGTQERREGVPKKVDDKGNLHTVH